MGEALENPVRPFVAILGGAKVADKIGVIKNLLAKCDSLLIGGGMAYTFFKAMGYEIGDSLLDENSIDLARELMAEAKERGVQLLLPVDTVVADKFDAEASYKTVDANAIPAGWMGMDIGEKTRALYADVIKNAKTVIWNGPMVPGDDHHLRRRFCFCRKEAGVCFQNDSYFHWRRCFPGVFGG